MSDKPNDASQPTPETTYPTHRDDAVRTAATLYLPHEIGKEVARYRHARSEAIRLEVTLELLPAKPAKFEPGDAVRVPRNADPATYRRLKATAEAKGVSLVFEPDPAA